MWGMYWLSQGHNVYVLPAMGINGNNKEDSILYTIATYGGKKKSIQLHGVEY